MSELTEERLVPEMGDWVRKLSDPEIVFVVHGRKRRKKDGTKYVLDRNGDYHEMDDVVVVDQPSYVGQEMLETITGLIDQIGDESAMQDEKSGLFYDEIAAMTGMTLDKAFDISLRAADGHLIHAMSYANGQTKSEVRSVAQHGSIRLKIYDPGNDRTPAKEVEVSAQDYDEINKATAAFVRGMLYGMLPTRDMRRHVWDRLSSTQKERLALGL